MIAEQGIKWNRKRLFYSNQYQKKIFAAWKVNLNWSNDFMFLNKCFNRDRYIYKLHIDNELSESMNYLEIYKFLPGLSGSKKGTY